LDKPIGGGGKFASTQGMYDDDILDDAALQLIVRPEKTKGGKNAPNTAPGSSVFDYVHPNCMVFNSNGRLFVGDSRGHISVWDITLKNGDLHADNFF